MHDGRGGRTPSLFGRQVRWGSGAVPTQEQRAYFAQRATEVRQMAEKASDPDIRKTLEEMAGSYDKLVEEADRIAVMRGRVPDI